MTKFKLFLFFCTFTINSYARVNYSSEPVQSICNNIRIKPGNYASIYHDIMLSLKPFLRNRNKVNDFAYQWKSFLTFNSKNQNNSTEVCRWNKFIFTDFMIYFDQAQNLSKRHKLEYSKLNLLKLRDEFYSDWLETLKYQHNTGFADYEDEDLSEVPFKDFISRKSSNFKELNSLTDLVSKDSVSNNSDTLINAAVNDVISLVEARSIFNSIFTSTVFPHLLDKTLSAELTCIKQALESSNVNIYNESLNCVNANKSRLLFILGAVSSQRIYLLRDLKGWVEDNYTKSEFDTFMFNAGESARIYFLLETYSAKWGNKLLYPPSYATKMSSSKPYHFYSVAFIASHLKEKGYSQKLIHEIAPLSAIQYKKTIQKTGILYNLILGADIESGSVGDKESIINEQKLGAVFGAE